MQSSTQRELALGRSLVEGLAVLVVRSDMAMVVLSKMAHLVPLLVIEFLEASVVASYALTLNRTFQHCFLMRFELVFLGLMPIGLKLPKQL